MSQKHSKREKQVIVLINLAVKSYLHVAMLSEDTKILEFSQYCKYDKMPFIIYADLEYLIEKIDGCKSKPEKLSKTKVS